MKLLTTLAARAGSFAGYGVNQENEAFAGRLVVTSVMAGRAATLHHTALGLDRQKLHEEFTLLSQSDQGGLCLWPVMAELPVVMPHHAVADPAAAHDGVPLVFGTGPRDADHRFREEISIACRSDGGITHTHAWGMPGGSFEARSRPVRVASFNQNPADITDPKSGSYPVAGSPDGGLNGSRVGTMRSLT